MDTDNDEKRAPEALRGASAKCTSANHEYRVIGNVPWCLVCYLQADMSIARTHATKQGGEAVMDTDNDAKQATDTTNALDRLAEDLLQRWMEWARAHGHATHAEGIAWDSREFLARKKQERKVSNG